jgi:hypothetical protein
VDQGKRKTKKHHYHAGSILHFAMCSSRRTHFLLTMGGGSIAIDNWRQRKRRVPYHHTWPRWSETNMRNHHHRYHNNQASWLLSTSLPPPLALFARTVCFCRQMASSFHVRTGPLARKVSPSRICRSEQLAAGVVVADRHATKTHEAVSLGVLLSLLFAVKWTSCRVVLCSWPK